MTPNHFPEGFSLEYVQGCIGTAYCIVTMMLACL